MKKIKVGDNVRIKTCKEYGEFGIDTNGWLYNVRTINKGIGTIIKKIDRNYFLVMFKYKNPVNGVTVILDKDSLEVIK